MAELTVTLLLLLVPVAFLWLLGRGGKTSGALREESLSTIDDLLPRETRIDSTRVLLAEFNHMLWAQPGEQRELALAILAQIRHDFLRLEYVLSRAAKFLPELTFSGEFRRLCMGAEFRLWCEFIRFQVLIGWPAASGLNALAGKLDALTVLASVTINQLAQADTLPLLRADLRN